MIEPLASGFLCIEKNHKNLISNNFHDIGKIMLDGLRKNLKICIHFWINSIKSKLTVYPFLIGLLENSMRNLNSQNRKENDELIVLLAG